MTVRYRVSGGFAGLSRSLTINPSGRTTLDLNGRVRHGEMPSSEVEEITEALDASGLFTTRPKLTEPSRGADLQKYRITYRRHTVEVWDTAIPSELEPAVHLLNDALREQSRTS